MPFHRVTLFLAAAAESLVAQTLDDWELLAVDNGTGAGRAALGPAGADPRVRIVPLPENVGIARARNAGVAAASGEFVALLDYDDLAWPRRLEKQVAALRADPALGLLGCHADRIDEAGRRTGWEFTLASAREQQAFLRYTMPAVASGYTGRREVFVRFPFRPEFDFAEDYDFLARASEPWRTAALPEPLVSYRHYSIQTTQARFTGQVFCGCLVRLLAARRRAGRAEEMGALLAEFPEWRQQTPSLGETFARFARRSNAEGFADLAVYHARKLLAVDRSPGAVALAAREFLRAARSSPGQAAFLARLFLRGPLRAHALRPLGPAGER